MTKQKRLEIYKKRQLMSEEEKLSLDNLLFDVAENSYKYPDPYGTIEILLEKGADPNFYRNGKTVVHLFSRDYFRFLELCIEYGGDLSAKTQKHEEICDYGYTALHYACSHGLKENVELILSTLQKDGRLEEVAHTQTAIYKYTPRICASQGIERAEVHKILDKYNVPHNIPDSKMRTELSWSASFDDIEAMFQLKETGSLAIIYDENGKVRKVSDTPQLSTEARKILFAMEKEENIIAGKPEMVVEK